MEKVLLIDGHSIANRAFYGVPFLSDSSGRPTNAVYGFFNILMKLLDEEKPENLAVAFDLRQPTFRHEMYPGYKGNRKPSPPELHEQVEAIRSILKAMNVTVAELPGFEADDVIGTLAEREKALGRSVIIVSGDRDLLQLSREDTCVMIPATKHGQTAVTTYFPKDVKEKYGVTPEEFIDVKAIMGDSSDNISGVPGIGEKGATAIISKWHSVEEALAHIDEVEPKRVREALRANSESALFSKKLVTIITDAPVLKEWIDCKADAIFTPEAYWAVRDLDLKTLAVRFAEKIEKSLLKTGAAPEKKSKEQRRKITILPDEKKDLKEAFKNAASAKLIAMSPVYSKREDSDYSERVAALFFTYDGEEFFYLKDPDEADILNILAKAGTVAIFEFKRLLRALPEEACCRISALPVDAGYIEASDYVTKEDLPPVIELSVAAYLIDSTRNSYEADDIAALILDTAIPSAKERVGKNNPHEALITQGDDGAFKWFLDMTETAFSAAYPIWEQLKSVNMDRLYSQIELPLTVTLAKMESEGIFVEKDRLKEYGEELKEKIDRLEEEIYELAGGMPFNINSPKQLGEVLFERLQIPGGKKTRTGYSTAADVLEKLASDYPIAERVLEYRTCAKLKSTYADGLAAFICSDGRIRSKFHQTVTATGRLSSSEPNLQNIPVRIEPGKRIRKVFVAKEGHCFVDADYSQVELRVLAHLSNDENLIDAYSQAQDIHAITASKVFNVPLDEVTPIMRRNAKAVNFGIVYGISAFGLSQGLSITRKEALKYIEQYFQTYPKVKEWLDKTVAEAKKSGYTVTMSGRRRMIPELKSSNFMTRSFGERVAMNSPVQGTAADIIKIAMNRVDRRLSKEMPLAKLILQVHDELLIECPEAEVRFVSELLKEEMSAALKLKVKLEVDVHDGKSWDTCK